mgnify:CR=1 FL=1
MSIDIDIKNQGHPPETYAQWVRSSIIKAKAATHDTYTLFGSSVAEPVALLQGILVEGFTQPLTDCYQSAFFDGNPVAREELAKQYDVRRSQVLCTTGATGALSLICRAYLHPGDHVLVESPGFDLFAGLAKEQLAHVSHISRKGPTFQLDIEEIAQSITERTKLIILSNLHNPSGFMLSAESMKQIAALAEKRDILVVVDEVYADYAKNDPSYRPAVSVSPNFATISSLTKNLGLNTLRCGWIVCADRWLSPIKNLNDKFEFGVSKLAHAVAAMVLRERSLFDQHGHDVMEKARPIMAYYHERWCQEKLISGLLPDHGCIVFPRLSQINDTMHFSDWLANRYGVYVVPGEYFGAAGHVRIGFALDPALLDKSLSLFEDGLNEYLARRSVKSAHR